MTTHYEILKKWIDSCETEPQIDTVISFVRETLVTDEKQRDDIMDYINLYLKRRSWIASKVSYQDTDSALEMFTDLSDH